MTATTIRENSRWLLAKLERWLRFSSRKYHWSHALNYESNDWISPKGKPRISYLFFGFLSIWHYKTTTIFSVERDLNIVKKHWSRGSLWQLQHCDQRKEQRIQTVHCFLRNSRRCPRACNRFSGPVFCHSSTLPFLVGVSCVSAVFPSSPVSVVSSRPSAMDPDVLAVPSTAPLAFFPFFLVSLCRLPMTGSRGDASCAARPSGQVEAVAGPAATAAAAAATLVNAVPTPAA